MHNTYKLPGTNAYWLPPAKELWFGHREGARGNPLLYFYQLLLSFKTKFGSCINFITTKKRRWKMKANTSACTNRLLYGPCPRGRGQPLLQECRCAGLQKVPGLGHAMEPGSGLVYCRGHEESISERKITLFPSPLGPVQPSDNLAGQPRYFFSGFSSSKTIWSVFHSLPLSLPPSFLPFSSSLSLFLASFPIQRENCWAEISRSPALMSGFCFSDY